MKNWAPISRRRNKQTIVARSVAEAEYEALFLATHEAVWMKSLQEESEAQKQLPVVINEDNGSAQIKAWPQIPSSIRE